MPSTTVSVNLPEELIAGEKYIANIIITVGDDNISAGAKIRVEFPCYWSWGDIQTYDSRKENYVEVRMSNPNVGFITHTEWSHSILIEITEGILKANDKIEIICGKRISDVSGIKVSRWATITADSQIWSTINVTIDRKGDGQYSEVKGLPVIMNVKAAAPEKIIISCPSICECDKEYEAKISIVDKHHNLLTDYNGYISLNSSNEMAEIPDKCKLTSGIGRFKLKISPAGIYTITGVLANADREDKKITGTSNPIVCDSNVSDYKLFWGDIHGHSNVSDGVCSVDDYYVYARDVAGLDFTALTDHDARWGRRLGKDLSEAEWKFLKAKAREYNEPGKFVTFQAYEWTSNTHGHRNVYYLEDDPPIFRCSDSDSDTAEKLWEKLKGKKVMTIPHHPSGLRFCIANGCAPVDWTVRNDQMQRLAEIFSVHGNSEYFGNPQSFILMYHAGHFIQDALKIGHRFGIISSSDCHNGHPGLSGLYDHHSYDPAEATVSANCHRGCLVGVYATELTREAIWDALWNKRCYATTGKRIILDFRVDGHFIGEEYKSDENKPKIVVKAIGTAPIKYIEIIKNNNVIMKHNGKDIKEELVWYDDSSQKGDTYYYARVTQIDGEYAWSSPIWVNQS